MSDQVELQQGSVVSAEVADPRGLVKRRPVLIITPTDEIVLNGTIVALAITTTFPDPPESNQVLLPWHSSGYCPTGLRRRSAVVCDWAVPIRPSQVKSVTGFLPTKYLLEVMSRRQQLERKPDETEDGSS